MNHDFENLAARAAPAIFVVFWSTGFVATKYVLNGAEPLTYLAIRMAVVVGLMAIIVTIAQGVEMGRPSLLKADAEKQNGTVTATYIGGRCVPVMSGTIELA